MKKAFTMLELVFVIVVVGILSYMVASSFTRNPLREAADQVVSHIRYTQHLAMMDDKFVPNVNMSKQPTLIQQTKEVQYWFKSRWMIQFRNLNSGNDLNVGWLYSIYSDQPSTINNASYNRTPSQDELAIDPQTGKYLTGAKTYSNDGYMENLRLEKKYGVVVNARCSDYDSPGTTTQHFLFDSLGRPYCGPDDTEISTNPYGRNFLMKEGNITLTNNGLSLTIKIEPETGYAHIP